jgi:two-component system response regulator
MELLQAKNLGKNMGNMADLRIKNEILIVDDSARDAELLTDALNQVRVKNPIRHIPSCVRAIAHLRSPASREFPSPPVIFIDFRLPGMDGYEFLKWIQTEPHFKDSLMVGTSGCHENGYIYRAYELGALSFVPKPCTPNDLKALIAHYPQFWQLGPPDSAPEIER